MCGVKATRVRPVGDDADSTGITALAPSRP